MSSTTIRHARPLIASLFVLLLAASCDTADDSKNASFCSESSECDSGSCYKGSCYTTCISDVDCDGEEHCVLTPDEGSGSEQICKVPADGTAQCQCTDEGATLEPEVGCEGWGDQFECTAWHSVGGEDGVAYETGTRMCLEGGAVACCISIVCP